MPLIGVLIPMAVSLAGAPSGVKIFSEEKTVFIREASSGHSKLAYYIGKVLANNHRLFLSALHFSGIFVFFSSRMWVIELPFDWFWHYSPNSAYKFLRPLLGRTIVFLQCVWNQYHCIDYRTTRKCLIAECRRSGYRVSDVWFWS